MTAGATPATPGGAERRRGAVGPLRPLLLLCLLAAALPAPLRSADVAAPKPGGDAADVGQLRPGPLPDRPTAYLITVGPGDAVWERFGHNMIWIHDPASGVDEAYNYGLFSFEQENFLLRFVRGEMLYWMQGFGVRRQLAEYRARDRSIRIQELALEPAEVAELHDFLERNERPENRFYRYHYYRDNCSTRVRDALDGVLDGRLGAWARSRRTDASFRDHTLRQTHGLFWVSVGMHFGLGPSVDEPLSAWQAMFIPMEMEEHLRDFSVETGSGESVSFVRSEWTFYEADRSPTPETTPRWTAAFAGGGVLGAALLLVLGLAARRTRSGARVGFLSVATLWLLAVGLTGLLISLLWAFTDHVDTRWNVNLLHATPVHLALAATLWSLFRGRAWARRGARLAAGVVVALSLLGLLLHSLPGIGQTNAEFLALLVPTNLALAWVVWRTPTSAATPGAGTSGADASRDVGREDDLPDPGPSGSARP